VSRVTDPQGRPAIYPAGGPYYPTAFAEANGLSGDLQLFYRTMTLGRRVTEVETLAQRLVIGAQGTFGEWDYNVAYNHSENTSRERFTSGWVYGSKVLDALQSGLVNPWGSFDEDGQALLEAAEITGQVRKATGRLDQVDARWSGALTALPAGPLAMAFGVEGRREELTDRPSEVLDSGDVIGGVVVNPQDASREVYAAFVEFNLPLARGFVAQLSARYDHYSDFGSTTNPKVAVRWQPATSVLLRASWGTGFRAPSLPDLFTPVQSSTLFGTSFPYEDPVRCPVTQLDYDCGFDGFQGRSGGNPLLVPETSEQWGTGFVWQPLSGLSIGIDYWSIRKRNVIGTLTGDLIFGNFDLFAPTNVVRAAAGPAYPELPGPIEYVIVWGQNIGNNRTSGIDVTLRARSAATGAGSFALDVDGTYISEWTEELVGLPPTSALGKSVLAPIPRWRSYARLRWDYGPWTATLGNRFQSGYTDAGPTPEGTTRNVGSYSLFDLQAAYAGFKDTSISVGVRNLFDRDPPFSNAPGGFQIGYDPRYADPRGRSFYARFSYAFR
jgi:iron complex outermembrane receptor protein